MVCFSGCGFSSLAGGLRAVAGKGKEQALRLFGRNDMLVTLRGLDISSSIICGKSMVESW
jgi:hypothetical protein